MPPKFAARVSAYHLDMLIFTLLFEGVHIWWIQERPELATNFNLCGLFLVVTSLVFVIPTKLYGQTLGKKINHLKVVSAKSSDESLPWADVIERELILKTVCAFFLGFGFWRARKDPEGRAFHDTQCSTRVVSLAPEGQSRLRTWLLEAGVTLLTFVAGVGLILWAFIATSLPLPAIEAQLRANSAQLRAGSADLDNELGNGSSGNFEIEGLSGSLLRGIHVRHLKKSEDTWSVLFENAEIHLDAKASFDQGRLVFRSLSAKSAVIHIESFGEGIDFAQSFLQAVWDEENPSLKIREIQIASLKFSSAATSFSVKELHFTAGLLQAKDMTGTLDPKSLPLLKKPLDFSFATCALDVRGQGPQVTACDGALLSGQVHVSANEGKLKMTGSALDVSEFFKTEQTFPKVMVSLEGIVSGLADFLALIHTSRGLKVCGRGVLAAKEATDPRALENAFLKERNALENVFVIAPFMMGEERACESRL